MAKDEAGDGTGVQPLRGHEEEFSLNQGLKELKPAFLPGVFRHDEIVP
jgi:hypothetical protein